MTFVTWPVQQIAIRRVVLDGSHCAAAGLHHKPLVFESGKVLEYLGLGENSFHIHGSGKPENACTSTLIHVFGGPCPLAEGSFSHTWPGISLFFPMFPACGRSEHRIIANPCHVGGLDLFILGWDALLRSNLDRTCWKHIGKIMNNTFTLLPLLANLE